MGGKIEGSQIVCQLNYQLEHIHHMYKYVYMHILRIKHMFGLVAILRLVWMFVSVVKKSNNPSWLAAQK